MLSSDIMYGFSWLFSLSLAELLHSFHFQVLHDGPPYPQ